MIKVIHGIEFKAVAGVIIDYKEQFGNEYYDDIEKLKVLQSNMAKGHIVVQKFIDITMNLAYLMARHNNVSMEKLNDINFSLEELTEINQFFQESIEIQKDDEDNENDKTSEFCSERFLLMCKNAGITMQEIYMYSAKFILQEIKEYCEINAKKEEEKSNVRKATQADFDAFRNSIR